MALQAGSGKYFQDTLAGNVFIGTTAAAGVTVPAYSNTAAVFGIWNPANSGRNAWLISCEIGWVSTTAAPSNFCYGYQTGAGNTIATGGPVTAVTAVTPVNSFLGLGNTSVVKFFPATITLTTGCSLIKTMGVSQLTTTGATSVPMWTAREDFDGKVAVTPGTVFVVGGNIATTTVCDITLVWEEI
jgi:hypothetical protein